MICVGRFRGRGDVARGDARRRRATLCCLLAFCDWFFVVKPELSSDVVFLSSRNVQRQSQLHNFRRIASVIRLHSQYQDCVCVDKSHKNLCDPWIFPRLVFFRPKIALTSQHFGHAIGSASPASDHSVNDRYPQQDVERTCERIWLA